MTSSLDTEKQEESQNFHKTVDTEQLIHGTVEELNIQIKKPDVALWLIQN